MIRLENQLGRELHDAHTDESNPRKLRYGLAGVPTVLKIWPNVELPMLLSGKAKFGWLNTLYADTPTPSDRRSLISGHVRGVIPPSWHTDWSGKNLGAFVRSNERDK